MVNGIRFRKRLWLFGFGCCVFLGINADINKTDLANVKKFIQAEETIEAGLNILTENLLGQINNKSAVTIVMKIIDDSLTATGQHLNRYLGKSDSAAADKLYSHIQTALGAIKTAFERVITRPGSFAMNEGEVTVLGISNWLTGLAKRIDDFKGKIDSLHISDPFEILPLTQKLSIIKKYAAKEEMIRYGLERFLELLVETVQKQNSNQGPDSQGIESISTEGCNILGKAATFFEPLSKQFDNPGIDKVFVVRLFESTEVIVDKLGKIFSGTIPANVTEAIKKWTDVSDAFKKQHSARAKVAREIRAVYLLKKAQKKTQHLEEENKKLKDDNLKNAQLNLGSFGAAAGGGVLALPASFGQKPAVIGAPAPGAAPAEDPEKLTLKTELEKAQKELAETKKNQQEATDFLGVVVQKLDAVTKAVGAIGA